MSRFPPPEGCQKFRHYRSREPPIAAGRRDRGAPAAGLRYDPPLTLTDYADTQAKWYYRLKRENRRARAEGRPFANPVEPRPLKWRS